MTLLLFVESAASQELLYSFDFVLALCQIGMDRCLGAMIRAANQRLHGHAFVFTLFWLLLIFVGVRAKEVTVFVCVRLWLKLAVWVVFQII